MHALSFASFIFKIGHHNLAQIRRLRSQILSHNLYANTFGSEGHIVNVQREVAERPFLGKPREGLHRQKFQLVCGESASSNDTSISRPHRGCHQGSVGYNPGAAVDAKRRSQDGLRVFGILCGSLCPAKRCTS